MTPVDSPTSPLLTGGPEGVESAWTAKGSRRLNRLRAVVAKAILKSPEGGSPVADAVGLLHRVANGTEPATVETKVQAAGTLVRTAAALVSSRETGGATVNVDARSVTLQLGQGKPTHGDLASALALLAGSTTESVKRTSDFIAQGGLDTNGKNTPPV